MMFEHTDTPMEEAKTLETGQVVELGASIGNEAIILSVTKVLGDGSYKGDQVAPDPLDYRPFNENSRLKNQHFHWYHVKRIVS